MTESCLHRVEDLFHLGMQVHAAGREAFLSHECGDDQPLFEDAWSLIRASEEKDSTFDEPVIDLGFRVIATSQQRDLTGQTIDQFKIISLLGRGGMGEVYLAHDQLLDRKVALKFLCNELAEDNLAKKQLIAEAKAVARLDHPSICQIYSIQQLDGDMFLVMQYVEGVTLAELLRWSRLSESRQRDLVYQLLSGMTHIHENQIIHRDIKPHNIMITPHDRVKILDFGLAASPRPRPRKSVRAWKSSHETTPGTIRYMSPEQLRGEKLDFRSDVFSLGTLMFEILTGRRLFPQQEELGIAEAILSGEYSLDAIASCGSLVPIVSRCLSLEPLERFASAQELLQAFEERDSHRD